MKRSFSYQCFSLCACKNGGDILVSTTPSGRNGGFV